QYLGQNNVAAVSRSHRAAIRQGAPRLADGSRRADRGGAGRDARGRPAGALPGGHAEGSLDALGEASGRPAVARGATRSAGQTVGPGGRALRLGPKPRPRRQEPALAKAGERAIRRRQLKRLWARLKQLSTMELSREELLMKLGAARDQSRTAARLVVIEV